MKLVYDGVLVYEMLVAMRPLHVSVKQITAQCLCRFVNFEDESQKHLDSCNPHNFLICAKSPSSNSRRESLPPKVLFYRIIVLIIGSICGEIVSFIRLTFVAVKFSIKLTFLDVARCLLLSSATKSKTGFRYLHRRMSCGIKTRCVRLS
jgi:hypothetical protein